MLSPHLSPPVCLDLFLSVFTYQRWSLKDFALPLPIKHLWGGENTSENADKLSFNTTLCHRGEHNVALINLLLLWKAKLKIGLMLFVLLIICCRIWKICWNCLTIAQNVKPFCSGGVRKVISRTLCNCIFSSQPADLFPHLLNVTMKTSPILLWIQTFFFLTVILIVSSVSNAAFN